MVIYTCKLCDLTTHIKSHYERHCKTKKHLAKEKEENIKCQPNVNPCKPNVNPCQLLSNIHQCIFCDKILTTRQGKSRHQKICKKNPILSTQCQPQNVTQKLPIVTQKLPIVTSKIQDKLKMFDCPYCNKSFASRHGKSRHIKTCKVKKIEMNKEIEFELMKKEINELKQTNNSLINNIQNNTKIGTQNNGTINYLNIHYNNVLPIELFLENLKTTFQLSTSDRRCLLDTFNECGVDSFANTFCIIMKKNLVQQIQNDILPTLPLVCTDSNLRSIKEYHEDGWKITQSNESIDQMIDISNEQIFQSENTKVFISHKERKKVYDKMKKINSLPSMETDKKKQIQNIEKDNNQENEKHLEEINFQPDDTYNGLDDVNELYKNYDFSIIDDDLLEKNAYNQLS